MKWKIIYPPPRSLPFLVIVPIFLFFFSDASTKVKHEGGRGEVITMAIWTIKTIHLQYCQKWKKTISSENRTKSELNIDFGPRLYAEFSIRTQLKVRLSWGCVGVWTKNCHLVYFSARISILNSVIKSRFRFQLITFFTNQMFMTVKTGVEMYMYSVSVTRDTDLLMVADDVRIINSEANKLSAE